MTQDDILRIAKEADVWVAGQRPYQTQLERFAALVAAAEREACAQVCENYGPARVLSGEDCAAAIRTRG
jgi:hypothetical protein